MQGRLALSRGVLYVGRHTQAVHVRPYDLDGCALNGGFSFRATDGSASTLAGLDVDEDRGLWVADGNSATLRRFTLFGREVAAFGGVPPSSRDLRGVLHGLSDLAIVSDPLDETHPRLLVARRGWHRNAVQFFDSHGTWLGALRSEGDARQRFRGVRALGSRGRWICVCESGRGRVQVFRDGEFHFLFSPSTASGARLEPIAAAPLDDGRMVVACGGRSSALLLIGRGGRLERVLAEAGTGPGQVWEPNDLALEPGESEGQARLAVVDRDAERVQLFDLGGSCQGELSGLPGPPA